MRKKSTGESDQPNNPKPIDEVEASGEPVPTGTTGWVGYICALAGAVAVAAALVAFGSGFAGRGIVAAVIAVVLFGTLLALILRARSQPRDHLDRTVIRRRFRRESSLRHASSRR